MPTVLQDYRVFIATPSGLEVERNAFRDVLHEHNELDPQGRRIIFTPIGWELTLGGFGRPQELINKELIECDYFVLLLWDRWGSPPDAEGRFTSGCEEEFALALECLATPDRPMREVVVFFKTVDSIRLMDPGEQLKRVLNFKTELEKSKKHLWMAFSDVSSFQSYLRKYLHRWSRDLISTPIEHLDVLKKGIDAWNLWRASNPQLRPYLAGVDLKGVYLSSINFRDTDLSRSNLSEANLISADLQSANLTKANLSKTNFYQADLRKADLSGALLVGTHLDKAKFEGAIFGDTVCAQVDLEEAEGLDNIIHGNPSEIGISTIYNSNGKIADKFLRGCGLPESFIAFHKSLVNKPIEFYSCFISYSHTDKPFARRLHDQLQARGIRCWLDEHQMLPGHDLYEEVDRGIKLWDKVLLCASKNSLTSWWVDDEIQRAFNKEQQLISSGKKKVLSLIPLNLDGYLFSGDWKSAKANQVKSRLAADFTGWESDNAKFELEFERLVKALRSDEGREIPPPSSL